MTNSPFNLFFLELYEAFEEKPVLKLDINAHQHHIEIFSMSEAIELKDISRKPVSVRYRSVILSLKDVLDLLDILL